MLKWISTVLTCMIIIILLLFSQLFTSIKLETEGSAAMEKPDYRFQVMIQNTDEYFWRFFREGALVASREFNVYVEFIDVSSRNIDPLKKVVEMGLLSGVDGIALKASYSKQMQMIVGEIKSKGVAVVNYDNNNYVIPDIPIIGYNSYAMGMMAGEKAIEASSGIKTNVAVILSTSNNSGGEQYKNLIVQGIMDAFSKYGTINVGDIYTINSDMFEAEKVTMNAISAQNSPNLIICMDERSTPGVAQVLVDTNRVGSIKLIGYGVMPQTLDYIKRGVIYGSIYPDAYNIGYYTIRELKQSLESKNYSDYINTELYSIDINNIDQYLKGSK